MLVKLVTENREGYSGNPPENLKWRTFVKAEKLLYCLNIIRFLNL